MNAEGLARKSGAVVDRCGGYGAERRIILGFVGDIDDDDEDEDDGEVRFEEVASDGLGSENEGEVGVGTDDGGEQGDWS